MGGIRLIALGLMAIAAFAGNSILARYALADQLIGAGSYSVIRIFSGALILLPMSRGVKLRRDWPGGLSLAAYIALFSWAYISLSAGVGALILFACVQASVMVLGIARGESAEISGLAGMALALAGLALLVLPQGGSAPILPAILMAGAGIAWGIYTMLGRVAADAAGFTARSFLIGCLIITPIFLLDDQLPSLTGMILAIVSGALTSGLGYIIWNKISPSLGLAAVATVQLATPPAAALGGIIWLSEGLTLEFALASIMILGGILLTLRPRAKPGGKDEIKPHTQLR